MNREENSLAREAKALPGERGVDLHERGQLIFGENGAVILLTTLDGSVCREMDDFDLHIEQRARYPELVTMALIASLGASLIVILAQFLPEFGELRSLVLFCAIGFAGLFLIASACGCYREALAAEEVGGRANNLPRPQHITGFGGAVAITLALIVGVVFLVGQLAPHPFRIPGWAGHLTFITLGVLFVTVFLSSRLPALSTLSDLADWFRKSTDGIAGVGRFLSRVDAMLVFSIAPIGGLTLENAYFRYSALLGHILSGMLIAWFCPAPWGILAAVWICLLATSVFRRWGWIEHVRSTQIQGKAALSERRIARVVDLRDEAMTSLFLLVLMLPLGMRQVYLFMPDSSGFTLEVPSADSIWDWTGFFGVELLKALPFLDWADIYGAENGARINATSGLSMHTLFIARMIIDLVFLAALVQWVSISVAIERNKRDFLAGRNGINRLDERIEKRKISSLVQLDSNGRFQLVQPLGPYTNYDRLALARLKMRAGRDLRLLAAISAIGQASDKPITSPSEEFLEAAFMPHPDPQRLDEFLAAIEFERDFDLDNLLPAREQLSWKGNIETQRRRLVQLLIRFVPPSIERDRQFAQILHGEKQDSLRDVRVLVIDTLARNAKRNPESLAALQNALLTDPSPTIKQHILRTLHRFGLPTGLTDDLALTA